MKPDALWDAALGLARPLAPRTVFDVGAHRGKMSRLFLDAFPRARVHAFEPQPALHATLAADSAVAEGRLVAVQAALGDHVGRTCFHLGAASATSSRFPRNTAGRRYFRADFVMNGEIEVPLDTLDAYAARHAIESIELLKLDTQGGERDILRGAAGLLADARIGIVVTEFFAVPHYEGAPLLDEIWTELRRHGYGLFDLFPGPRGRNGQLRYGDAIFVSPRVRAEQLDAAPPEP